ncbi:hypothetical protein INQ51_01670 [Maribellus sp. CM-23]|uniref:hypothetical protein n=1 Tax=Maribellus sp. CM-23 TaxID=2781026 RepID=UPI001F491387|nr:hypothetical protein [Maribellus sp. CM-23]MCE4563007.1 hypothetical protein [Maribellus sp. CM-23]
MGKTFLIYVLPFFILSGILLVYSQMSLLDSLQNMTPGESFGKFTLLRAIPSYIIQILNYTVLTAVVYGYMDLHLKKKGDFTPEELWPGVLRIGLKLFMVYFTTFVMIIIASIFLVVPGIYLGVVFMLVPPVLIFEEVGMGTAMNRSFDIIKDNWWKTFGIIIIAGLIVYIFSIVVSLPLIITTALKTFHAVSANQEPQIFSTGYLVMSSIISIFQTLSYTVILIFVAIQYFSLVEVKERPTLQAKIDKLAEEVNE